MTPEVKFLTFPCQMLQAVQRGRSEGSFGKRGSCQKEKTKNKPVLSLVLSSEK